jgi:hypothetical protein
MTVVVSLLGLASLGLMARAFDLQVVRKQFYQRRAMRVSCARCRFRFRAAPSSIATASRWRCRRR